jgi:hypothetical protein
VGTRKSIKFIGVFAGAVLAVGLGTTPASAGTLYSDIPPVDSPGGLETTSVSSYVYNPSAPYGAAGGSFGNVIDPSSSGVASNATVVLSNYDSSAQNVSLTFNLYSVTGPGTPGTLGGGSSNGDQFYTLGTDATLIDSTTNASVTLPGDTLNGGLQGPPGQLNYVNFGLNNDALTTGSQYIWQVVVNSAADGLNFEMNNWVGSDNSCTSANPICTTNNPQYNTAYLTGVADDSNGGWASIGQGEVALNSVAGTPEPATLGLIGLGLLGIGVSIRKKSGKI